MRRLTARRPVWTSTLLAAILPMLAGASCSPSVKPGARVAPIATQAPAPTQAPPATSATWRLDPLQAWTRLAQVQVGAGTLEVGGGGERWLSGPSGRIGAQTVLPADLAGVLARGSGYDFVTASGDVYTASDPLGVASKSADARGDARAVSTGARAIVAIDDNGDLLRSVDGGRSYAKIALPGPAGGSVRAVALAGPVGAAIGLPQRLYVTRDDGATWSAQPSPDAAGLDTLAREGDQVVVSTMDAKYTLDGAGGSLRLTKRTAANSPAAAQRAQADRPVVARAIAGPTVVEVRGTPYAPKRDWTLSVSAIGAAPTTRTVAELAGCDAVSVAVRGESIALACDARGTPESGVDATAASRAAHWAHEPPPLPPQGSYAPDPDSEPRPPLITKVWTSDDGGKSLKEAATFVAGGAWQGDDDGIAIGPRGWMIITQRCSRDRERMPYCTPAHIRSSATAAFSEISPKLGVSFLRFANAPNASGVFALGTAGRKVSLFEFPAGSAEAEQRVELAHDGCDAGSSSLSVDAAGVARGFVRPRYSSRHEPLAFLVDPGAKSVVTTLSLPPIPPGHVTFDGSHALALSAGASPGGLEAEGSRRQLFESSDGAKTWSAVDAPSGLRDLGACSAFGCITSRGLRVGWGGASNPTSPPAKPALAYAKPLACKASGKWSALGGGSLPSADDVDIGSARWLLPTRDLAGRVTLHVNKRADAVDKLSAVTLTGPAPAAPKFGAETTVHVQPRGVVVRRYAYSRARKENAEGRYNPVDAQLVWWRPDTGKVTRAAVPKIPAFRVQRDPRGGYAPREVYPAAPEVLTLDASGLSFAPPEFGQATRPLYRFGDDGKNLKLGTNTFEGEQAVATSVDGESAVVVDEGYAIALHWIGSAPESKVWALRARNDDAQDEHTMIDFGGRPASAITARFLGVPRAWAVPLRPGDDPPEWTALPTQKSLGSMSRPCDAAALADGASYRFIAPYTFGTRHPVTVDADGTSLVLATDRAAVRGSTAAAEASACVSAMEASSVDDESDTRYEALIFPGDLQHAVLFRTDVASQWPQAVSMRPMECSYAEAALPDVLRDVAGFNAAAPNRALSRFHFND